MSNYMIPKSLKATQRLFITFSVLLSFRRLRMFYIESCQRNHKYTTTRESFERSRWLVFTLMTIKHYHNEGFVLPGSCVGSEIKFSCLSITRPTLIPLIQRRRYVEIRHQTVRSKGVRRYELVSTLEYSLLRSICPFCELSRWVRL